MRLSKPVRGRRPSGKRLCGKPLRPSSGIPYRKNKPVRSLKSNNPAPIKMLVTALFFISTGTCPTTTLRGNPRKKSDTCPSTSRPPQPKQPSDDPSPCGPQQTIVQPELQNVSPSGPSDSQPPDDAKTILINVFDSAIQRAEASGKDPKNIAMVRKISEFYATTTQSLPTPEKLLNILRSNSRNRKFEIEKNLSFIVDAWIEHEVKPSSMNPFDKFNLMAGKNLIATKLADKLIDAYDAFIDTKKYPSTQADYIQQPLPSPTSIEYSKLNTPLNSSPKKTGLSPEQQNPRASAPSPIKPPPLEIASSTILPTGIFETLGKINNDTQNGLKRITTLIDSFAPIQISTAPSCRIIQIPGRQL